VTISMSTLSEAAAKAAALAWVNKRGATHLLVQWYALGIAIAVREHAGHTGPPAADKWYRVWLFKPVKRSFVPQPGDLDLARGYVRLVRTLMGEKGDKVEVEYVGFE